MRRFLKNNLLILVLLNSSNIFNYLFQLTVGRSLSPADYGSFNALNSLAVVLSAPAAVLPLLFSRYTIQLALKDMGQVKNLLVKGFRTMVLVGGALFVTGLAALPWLKQYLHMDAALPIVIMLIQLTLSLLFPVLLGVIQGLQRFVAFGLGASSVPLFRCLGGFAMVYFLGWGVQGALLSGVLGVLVALFILCWSLREVFKHEAHPLPDRLFPEMRRYSVPVFLSTTMVMTLGNLDIVLVRHYCTPEESGLYSIAAILGRIALYLPGVLITVLFPAAAQAQDTGKEDPRILWFSMGLTAVLGGGFALACGLWPEFIIGLLFGEKYLAAAAMLQTISFAMGLLAVANVIFTYCMARSEFKYLWPLVGGVGLMLLLIALHHESALVIARNVLVSIAAILTGTLFWFLLSRRPAALAPQ